MSDGIEWEERLEALLTGALSVWRIDGRVLHGETAICTIQTETVTVKVERIVDDGEPFWEVTPADNALPPFPYGGIQGMLRAVRELLGAGAAESRLVIGPRGDL